MICPYCKENINDKELVCTFCGWLLKVQNDKEEQFNEDNLLLIKTTASVTNLDDWTNLCWNRFFRKYYVPIIKQILRKSGRLNQADKHWEWAEELAQQVQISIAKKARSGKLREAMQLNISFRKILLQKIEDKLNEYWKIYYKNKEQELKDNTPYTNKDEGNLFLCDLLEELYKHAINSDKFKPRERALLWILVEENELPKVKYIESTFKIKYENAKKIKQRFEKKLYKLLNEFGLGKDAREEELKLMGNVNTNHKD